MYTCVRLLNSTACATDKNVANEHHACLALRAALGGRPTEDLWLEDSDRTVPANAFDPKVASDPGSKEFGNMLLA